MRIGNNWNAITIIALSQTNPLKAVAEFVENSIDAGARNITLIRGKESGRPYLRVRDDGDGVRKDADGNPDFQYVATHICDSIKRQLKSSGARGLQGEFGIGLLGFWTVGENLYMSSTGANGTTYQMHMKKGSPEYSVIEKRTLIASEGTEVVITPLLAGIKQLSGEKIQWYLSSELRDRIRNSGVNIRVIDRASRIEYRVEPRKFEGRLLHGLPGVKSGSKETYIEVYLTERNPASAVGLYRSGTRVLENMADVPALRKAPWTTGCIQGIIDAPELNITPGTRTGLIFDDVFERFVEDLAPVEETLCKIIEDQERAEEEKASQDVLRSLQKAFREALQSLPAEEYDWFSVHPSKSAKHIGPADDSADGPDGEGNTSSAENDEPQAFVGLESEHIDGEGQRKFFEIAGPLYKVDIRPKSSVVRVGAMRRFSAHARDRKNVRIESGVAYRWEILEGEGNLSRSEGEIIEFTAGPEPMLTRLQVRAMQGSVECFAEAFITISDAIPGTTSNGRTGRGLPGYTFEKAPGELWRSRYDEPNNLIVVNSAHRDFAFATRQKSLKLRYICRLFAKELVLANFPGLPADQLMERLIELSLFTEENLR